MEPYVSQEGELVIPDAQAIAAMRLIGPKFAPRVSRWHNDQQASPERVMLGSNSGRHCLFQRLGGFGTGMSRPIGRPLSVPTIVPRMFTACG